MTRSIAIFVIAAALEIAGCFAFWLWLRRGMSAWIAGLGIASLICFAVVLTRVESPFAGRAYAAYGGIYVAASVGWLWLAEGQRPTGADLAGAGVVILGAMIILAAASRP